MVGRRTRLLATLVGAVGLVVAATAAWAGPEPELSAQEAADGQVVRDLFKGPIFEQIRAHSAELQAMLDRAPASYPLVERHGDYALVRDDGQGTPMNLQLLTEAAAKNQNLKLISRYNTYPTAAFLLGSYANETRQPDAALVFLDRGLKLQPDNSHLVSEKIAAFFIERRFADALALVEPWLATHPLAGDQNRARLLRAKGLALTELGRLDESEAAYQDSLKLEPGHKGALGELDYIAKLRAGGQSQVVGITTSDKARDVGRAAVTPPQQPAPPKP